MSTRFKVFASYNILEDLCDFIHVLIFVTVSKSRKKSQINKYSDLARIHRKVTHVQCLQYGF